MKYIKLYYSIFTFSLSQNAFRTYCALLRFMNTDTWYANVTMHKLAAAVGLSPKSISRGIRELQDKKLLTVIERHYQGQRVTNGYQLCPQRGGYVKLPVSALATPTTSCGFMIYCYLLKCADSGRKAFPSLNNISCALNIAVSTIVEQIKDLIKYKLLKKRHQIKKNRSFGHNLYFIFDFVLSGLKKKEKTRLARSARVSPQSVAEATTLNCKVSVRLKTSIVKGFSKILSFINRGTSNLSTQVLKPFLSIQRK